MSCISFLFHEVVFLLGMSGSVHWRKAAMRCFWGKMQIQVKCEMLTWVKSKEENLLQTEKSQACASFLVWWRWRERTSTWPSLLAIFNSFVFWGHLLHRLNCANPQSKLCSLHSCESGGNAEGQFNIDFISPIPFVYTQEAHQVLRVRRLGGCMGRATHQSFSRGSGRATGTAQSSVQLLCDLLHTRTLELPGWVRQMSCLVSRNCQIIQKGARKPVPHHDWITCC